VRQSGPVRIAEFSDEGLLERTANKPGNERLANLEEEAQWPGFNLSERQVNDSAESLQDKANNEPDVRTDSSLSWNWWKRIGNGVRAERDDKYPVIVSHCLCHG
jgi:hypothetical protein